MAPDIPGLSEACSKIIQDAFVQSQRVEASTRNVDFTKFKLKQPDDQVTKIWEKCRVFQPLQLSMAAMGMTSLADLAALYTSTAQGNARGGTALLERILTMANPGSTAWDRPDDNHMPKTPHVSSQRSKRSRRWWATKATSTALPSRL